MFCHFLGQVGIHLCFSFWLPIISLGFLSYIDKDKKLVHFYEITFYFQITSGGIWDWWRSPKKCYIFVAFVDLCFRYVVKMKLMHTSFVENKETMKVFNYNSHCIIYLSTREFWLNIRCEIIEQFEEIIQSPDQPKQPNQK